MDVKHSTHDWVNNLVHFSRGRTSNFFQFFCPISLDLLVISDCLNRYIIICHPDKIGNLLCWKMILVYQTLILVSGIFSFFFRKNGI